MKQDQIVVAIIALAVVWLLFRSCGGDDPQPTTETAPPITEEAPTVDPVAAGDPPATDDDDSASAATPEQVAAPVAASAALLGADDLPSGPSSVAQEGDVLLTSSRGVRFVVTAIGHRTGFQETGGNLVDIVVPGGVDAFDGMSSWFEREFPRQGAYTDLQLDAAGAVTVTGADSSDAAVSVATTWTLLPEEHDGVMARLGVSTTVRNGGEAALADYDLGDIIGWGGLRSFGPGFGRHLAGEKDPSLAWVGGEADDHAVLVVATTPMTGPHGSSWSDPVWRAETIAPGAEATYDRQLLVGRSLADLLPAAYALQGRETGTLTVEVREAPLLPVAGARVDFVKVDPITAAEVPWAFGATDAEGLVSTELPPGDYKLVGSSASRRSVHFGRAHLVAGGDERVAVVVSGEGRLAVSTTDENGAAIPVRYRFEGVGSTPDPDLGPAAFAVGGNRVNTTGPTVVPLPPGIYDVSVTAGPAWSLVAERVQITERIAGAEGTDTFAMTLTQVVPTAGWLQCDLHQHAAYSADSAVPPVDGVIASVSEGLDCIATTDHDAVADWSQHLKDSGHSSRILWMPGIEVTSETNGHFNAYPWDPALGVPDHFDKSAADIAGLLRSTAPGAVVQINHPRWGRIGMWDLVGLDDHSGLLRDVDDEGAATGATYDYDAVEVLNGTDSTEAEEVLATWLRMVDAGKQATIVGNSDSHSLVSQPRGSARTWVYVGATPDVATVVANLKEQRHATASTGPFLDIEATKGAVDWTVTITMHAPTWMPVDSIELLGGDPVGNNAWSLGTWEPGAPGVAATVEGGLRSWVVTAQVSADGADGWVVAVARGSEPMEPWSSATALAITNVVRLGQ